MEKQPNFADRLMKSIFENKSYLCVGLDPQLKYFPPHILEYCAKTYGPGLMASAQAIVMFNRSIIDATNESACAFKPQWAFYEFLGHLGVWAFEETVSYAKSTGKIVINDGKKEDGGDTSEAYAEGNLGEITIIGEGGKLTQMPNVYEADAITITPWIEEPNFEPFIRVAVREGRGIFIVTRTSFKPTSSLQEMKDENGEKGWVKLARKVSEMGKAAMGDHNYSSIGAVMGATYPEDAPTMQSILPKAFKLIPGFGVQGGGADDAVVCINDDGFGILPNNSRGTNYAWHPKFKSEFACDSRSFALAAARASNQARNALEAAVLKKIGKLPW